MAYDAVPRPQHRYLEESLMRSVPLGDNSDDAYSTILRVQRSYHQDGLRTNSMANSRRNFSPYERHFDERRPPRAYPGPRTVGPRYYDQPHRFQSRPGFRTTSGGSRVHPLPRRSTITSPRKPSAGHEPLAPVSTVDESEKSDDDDDEDLFEDCAETLVGENDINGDGVVDPSIVITNLSARATKLKDLGQQTLQMTQAERTQLRVSSLQNAGHSAGKMPREFSNTPRARERGATVVTRLPGFLNDTDSLRVIKNRNVPRTRTMDATTKRNLDLDTKANILSASTVNAQSEKPRVASNVSQKVRNRPNTTRRASLDSLERLAKGFKSGTQAKPQSSPEADDAGNGYATIISSSATMKAKLAEQRAQEKSDALLAAKLIKTVEEHQNIADQQGYAREGSRQKKATSPGRQLKGASDRDGGKSDLRKARAAINLLNWLSDEDATKKKDSATNSTDKKRGTRRFLKTPRRKFRTIVNGMRMPYRRAKGLLSRDEPSAQLQNVLESTNKSKLGFRARLSFLKLAMMGRKPGEQKLIEMLDLPEPPSVVVEARDGSKEPPVLQFQQKFGAGILESDGSVSAGRSAKLLKRSELHDDAVSDVTWVTCEKSDAEDIARGAARLRAMKRKNNGRLSRLDPGTRERLYPKRNQEELPPVPKIPEKFLEVASNAGADDVAPTNATSTHGNMMNRMRPIRRQHDLPAIAGGRTQIDTEELLYGARRAPRAYRDAQNNVATPAATEAGNWWNLWPIVKLFTEPMSETESSRGGSVFSEKPTITEQKYEISGAQAEIASSIYSNDGGNQSGSEFQGRGDGRRSVYVV